MLPYFKTGGSLQYTFSRGQVSYINSPHTSSLSSCVLLIQINYEEFSLSEADDSTSLPSTSCDLATDSYFSVATQNQNG